MAAPSEVPENSRMECKNGTGAGSRALERPTAQTMTNSDEKREDFLNRLRDISKEASMNGKFIIAGDFNELAVKLRTGLV